MSESSARRPFFVLFSYHRLNDVGAMPMSMPRRVDKIDIPGGASRAVDQKK